VGDRDPRAVVADLQQTPTVEEAQKFQQQMSLYDLMEAATKWYEHQLHDKKNKKKNRGEAHIGEEWESNDDSDDSSDE